MDRQLLDYLTYIEGFIPALEVSEWLAILAYTGILSLLVWWWFNSPPLFKRVKKDRRQLEGLLMKSKIRPGTTVEQKVSMILADKITDTLEELVSQGVITPEYASKTYLNVARRTGFYDQLMPHKANKKLYPLDVHHLKRVIRFRLACLKRHRPLPFPDEKTSVPQSTEDYLALLKGKAA